jgi:hypothetical protein
MYTVRIKTLPNKKVLPKALVGRQVDGGLSLTAASYTDAYGGKSSGSSYDGIKNSISAVSRDEANLEAEGGESAFGNISGQNIPDHVKINGKRHTDGGVPLNLPDDTFIFSDTASMKITDPAILAMFNKNPKKGGYTPAELAKPYDIQKYKSILLDPDSGKLERKTAELMIKNMIMKLGALALAQEAKKGFPQGIPEVAKPYMEANGISEEDLIPELKAQAEQMAMQQQQMQQQMQQQGAPQGNPMMQQQQQAEMPDQAMAQDQAMANQGQQQFPAQMPSGAPVATPENTGSMQGQPMMQPGMRYGGIRDLIEAEVGMQQPSEEEMMMMEQQQGPPQGPPPQQQADPMQQMMQYVGQALQQGAKPEEVVAELLQKQVPPQNIAQVFVELGMPEDQVQQLIMGVAQQMQGGQGQPQGPPQGGPMAAYGMQMGGYDMPFYNKMAYGGVPKFPEGGVFVNNIPSTVIKTAPGTGWTSGTVTGGGPNTQGWYQTTHGQGESVTFHSGGGGGTEAGTAQGVCKKLLKSGNIRQVILEVFPRYLKGVHEGDPGFEEAMTAAIAQLSANPLYKDCIKAASDKFDTQKAVHLDPTGTDCPECDPPQLDANGQKIMQQRDPITGECTPCPEYEDVCKCPNPNDPSKQVVVPCNEDGSDPDCELWERSGGSDAGSGVRKMDPHWTKNAQLNVIGNALMPTAVKRQNVVVPGSTEYRGHYDDYLSRLQGVQGSLNTVSDVINQSSGSTADQQSMIKDLVGKGLEAGTQVVSGVHTNNQTVQNQVNAGNAQLQASNQAARTGIFNQGLGLTAAAKNQEQANKAKKMYNTMRGVMDANTEMANLVNIASTTPQYAPEFDYGTVYNTGMPSNPNPINSRNKDTEIQDHMRRGMTYKEAYETWQRDQRLPPGQVKFGGSLKKGGFMYSTFPFSL